MPNDSKPFQKWDLNTVSYFSDKLELASGMLLIVPNYKENIEFNVDFQHPLCLYFIFLDLSEITSPTSSLLIIVLSLCYYCHLHKSCFINSLCLLLMLRSDHCVCRNGTGYISDITIDRRGPNFWLKVTCRSVYGKEGHKLDNTLNHSIGWFSSRLHTLNWMYPRTSSRLFLKK